MSLQFQVEDRLVTADVRADGDRLVVELLRDDGNDIGEPLVLERVDPHTMVVNLPRGLRQTVYVALDEQNVWLATGGETHQFPRPDRQAGRRRRGGAGDAARTVTPPMPGQVIKIEVAVGDTVAKGQTVAVVSAMKMETPLKAPYAGEVTAVNTEVGTQVNPGDVLVEIARAE